jgi:hypothetical protein
MLPCSVSGEAKARAQRPLGRRTLETFQSCFVKNATWFDSYVTHRRLLECHRKINRFDLLRVQVQDPSL